MSLNCGLENTLESPLDSKRSNQIILKEISPELEGLMLKLKLQYFGHLMWRTDPDSGKDGRQEGKGTTEDDIVGWHHRLDRHEFEKSPGVGVGQGSLVLQSLGSQRVGCNRATELTDSWETQKKWIAHQNGQNSQFKYHLQLNTIAVNDKRECQG